MKKIFITIFCISISNSFVNKIYAQEKIEILSYSSVEEQKDKPLISVEQMPQFPGGDYAMMQYIKDNIQYPKSAVKKGIEGRVTVRFVVSKDGSVEDVQIVRSLDLACDKEATRIIKSMPKWTPGEQNGIAVNVYYTLPVQFKLQDDKKDINNNPIN